VISTATIVSPSVAGHNIIENQNVVKPTTDITTNRYVRESARKIPIIDTADVVILGGGPAGVSAAISAARCGVDVMLLERQYYLGGLWTGCCVLPVIDTCGVAKDGSWTKCIFGNAEEIIKELRSLGMCIDNKNGHPTPDPEATKYVLEDFVGKYGIRLLYNCQGASVTMSGDKIDSIIVETKSGRLAIKGKVFIDCSGDGDIMEWTGEDFKVIKHKIGAMWRVGNAKNLNSGKTPIDNVKLKWMGGENNQDGLNVYNQTRLMLKNRKIMWEKAMADRKKPGCENLFLLDSTSLLGVRSTRTLNSMHNVCWEESLKYTEYDDCIGLSGGDASISYNNGKMPGKSRPVWQIPYGSLVPKRVQNLLVAGRCFGYDEDIIYDAREIGTCFVTGQAAGTAAALAVQERTSVQEMDISKLRSNLISQGAKLEY